MGFGFQTWNAQGQPNNTGIVKVFAVGTVGLGADQRTGSWGFNVPSGYALDWIFTANGENYTNTRRRVNITGNVITLTDATNDYSPGTDSALPGWLVAFIKKV